MPWEGHERQRHSNPYTSQKETFHQKLNHAGIFVLDFLASRIVRIWISVKLPVCALLLWSPACLYVMSNPATPWTVSCQVPLSMEFSRQEYWCGLPFPSPGDLPNPGIEPVSPTSPALAEDFFLTTTPPQKPYWLIYSVFFSNSF